MQVQPDGSVIVPAGEYILGDPCYAVPSDCWMDFVDDLHRRDDSVGSASGIEILSFQTAYGDGSYEGSDHAEYGVDSGMIGLVPADFPGISEMMDGLHFRITLAEPTKCWRDGKDMGMLHFGSLVINTVGSEGDEGVCPHCGGDL